MNNSPIILMFICLFCLVMSCKKDCSPCFKGPWHYRIAILDSMNRDLLNPHLPMVFGIKKIIFSTGEELKFGITHIIGGDVAHQIYFVDIVDSLFDQKSLDTNCDLYFYYEQSNAIDTIAILQTLNPIEIVENCYCNFYALEYTKLNGKLINEYDTLYHTGAAIIRK